MSIYDSLGVRAIITERERYLANGSLTGPPHHGLGRPMKVGKEVIAGLVVALRRFLARAHQAGRQAEEGRLATILAALAGLPGIRAEHLADGQSPRPYATAVVRIDERVVKQTVETIINTLIAGDPPIAVSQNFLHERAIGLVASVLQPGEERTAATRLRDILIRRG
jgi:D-glucosaminate-6-phosphate ammonia-lyase